MGGARITTDHDLIRRWAESRGGHPARAQDASGVDAPGRLRIDFPGFSGQGALEDIDWDTWFETFEANHLAFLFQEETSDGALSRFSKLVSREE